MAMPSKRKVSPHDKTPTLAELTEPLRRERAEWGVQRGIFAGILIGASLGHFLHWIPLLALLLVGLLGVLMKEKDHLVGY